MFSSSISKFWFTSLLLLSQFCNVAVAEQAGNETGVNSEAAFVIQRWTECIEGPDDTALNYGSCFQSVTRVCMAKYQIALRCNENTREVLLSFARERLERTAVDISHFDNLLEQTTKLCTHRLE